VTSCLSSHAIEGLTLSVKDSIKGGEKRHKTNTAGTSSNYVYKKDREHKGTFIALKQLVITLFFVEKT